MTARDEWRHAPSTWSFSALRDARDCPRRWSLRTAQKAARASVSAASDRSPGLGALRGQICHAALERMIETHRTHAGPAWGSPALQAFWRQHLPRGVVGLVREEALRALGVGRRDPALEGRLRREVDEAIPSLATSVASLLRLTLSRSSGEGGAAIHAEVPVDAELAPGLRWRGRIDAVIRAGDDVTLIDYKTGAPSSEDMEQLVAYACMFALDAETRSWGVARRLAVLYARGGVDDRGAPVGEALEAERARVAEETRRVALRLASSPPDASPGADRCPRCEVRGACDAYWLARSAWGGEALRGSSLVDIEAVVVEVLADGRALRVRDGHEPLLARLDASLGEVARALAVGARVRLVGARSEPQRDFDDDYPRERAVSVGPAGLVVSNS